MRTNKQLLKTIKALQMRIRDSKSQIKTLEAMVKVEKPKSTRVVILGKFTPTGSGSL